MTDDRCAITGRKPPEPRMQNLPYPRTPEGDRFREVLREVFGRKPPEDFTLIAFDYAQIEMDILRRGDR